jgi:hypothetical protein
MNSATNTEDRLWFCDYLRQWDEHDFMHLTSSDEFFVIITIRTTDDEEKKEMN